MNWEQNVINSINEGVMVVDTDLTITFANRAVDSIGLNHEKIIGKSVFDVFPNLIESKSTFQEVINTGKEISSNQVTFLTYRGERKTTLTSTYPIMKDGVIIGAYEVFQDFSALQNLKEQLIDLQKTRTDYQNKVDNKINNFEENFHDFIGEEESILKLKNQIKLLANSPSPIFIYGETGTGKEVIVQNIHHASSKNIPLITQNCAAIPDNLLESYLFGTVKGAYTGALDKEGLFEIANGGILFLDEINSLSKSLQAKLLRVIQDQKVRRVGGTKEIPVNVRIIAATNVHPRELLANKEFRDDLYYRLCVLNIELPPLRNRKSDIPLLINHFIAHFNEKFGKRIQGMSNEAIEYLMNYSWPGNIRELKNMIERLLNIVQTDNIERKDIQLTDYLQLLSTNGDNNNVRETFHKVSFKEEIEKKERQLIMEALQQSAGNISQAARNLDIPQQTLSNKVKRYQLESYIYKTKLLKYE
ncbi:sigma 54-interacting transcriptional regulator [Psychrobacillus sp. NEAU-3TGS]|uniref:sigma-54 interaction domain-containing protein n=1 Tax=Psychrobacillus sp. NEAU-3TGS TaxID=2995412 RepID=UPI002495BF91|nr:sigma 54-interacting transcriptional regulator [Psychrobacillus sp. NEAU-3TGS]MDI2587587.1 sigma 54-interacting transcriptional regulator [Psychrobacillus sp. NEAU-3TGS]